MSRIQKRTKQVRDTIQREWQYQWWKFILDNRDKPWILDYISLNPNITIRDILDNSDKPWNWRWISMNIFLKEKKAFRIKRYREHLAAVLIQNAYKNALVNPNCQLGINKIERDMEFAGVVV